MKKVDIMTLIEANNIGAYLQGFALAKTLEQCGYDYEFLIMPEKIVDNDIRKNTYFSKLKRYLKQKNFKLLFFKIKSGKKYISARQELKRSIFDKDKEYQTVIIGSDEMWNLNSNTFTHYPQYFGNDLKVSKLISYAPSANNTTIERIKDAGYNFKAFDYISVRDQNTYELVKAVDDIVPVKVVDPTFLIRSYNEFLAPINIKKEYILVYSYGINAEEIKKVKTYARREKLMLLSVGTYNSWCDRNIIVSPMEFLSYLKAAKYVVTSTFHGSALSIIFNKQFVVFLEQSQKIYSLLNEFKLENRIVKKEDMISDIFNTKTDYEEINKEIDIKRNIAIDFLREALDGK